MSCTDNETFFVKLRETLDTNIVLQCASVKAFIEIFEKKTKKPFRIIVTTKRSIFIVNHLSRLLV